MSAGADSASARKKAARRLRARPDCDPDHEPFVRFRWSPAPDRGRAQRVDYTEFFDGFSTGDFHKSRRLPSGKRRWRTADIESNLHYEWRVMTKHAGRWISSAVKEFDGPVCVQNGQ